MKPARGGPTQTNNGALGYIQTKRNICTKRDLAAGTCQVAASYAATNSLTQCGTLPCFAGYKAGPTGGTSS
jgi:hypothetical protein